MANKFLDDNGLLYLWQKIINKFATKDDLDKSKTTVENVLTSTSTTNALSANQGKVLDEKIKALSDNMGDLGYGDMMKATYDTNNNGKVDSADDSDKLGGQLPSFYAEAEHSHATTDINGFENEVYAKAYEVSGMTTGVLPDGICTDGVIKPNAKFVFIATDGAALFADADAYYPHSFYALFQLNKTAHLPFINVTDVTPTSEKLTLAIKMRTEEYGVFFDLQVVVTTTSLLRSGRAYMLSIPFGDDAISKFDSGEPLEGYIVGLDAPTDTVPTANSTNMLTSGAIYTALQNVAVSEHTHEQSEIEGLEDAIGDMTEIAQGKCASYVFATVNELETWLTNTTNTAKLKVGDVFLVKAVDVPDYWWDGTAKQKLETTKVDLTAITNAEIDAIVAT